MKTVICPICNGIDLTYNLKYTNICWPDLEYFNNLTVTCCNSCGFGFSVPELSDEIVNQFYSSEYRRESSPFYLDFNKIEQPYSMTYRSLSQIMLAKHFVSFSENDCFLDIGPGTGESFATARKVLPNPRCVAIELSTGADLAYERVYKIKTFKTIQEFVDSRLKVKICLLSHSLEHYKLSWLKADLKKIRNLMDKGGILVAEVPFVDMREHSALRFEDSPHFLFFSIESIKLLFENNGWNVLFAESAGEPYNDWLQKINANKLIAKPRIFQNRIVKKSLSYLPKFAKKTFHYAISSKAIDFKNVEFSYCGNRTCLRLVASTH